VAFLYEAITNRARTERLDLNNISVQSSCIRPSCLKDDYRLCFGLFKDKPYSWRWRCFSVCHEWTCELHLKSCSANHFN